MKTSFSCSWLLCQSDVRPSTKPKYKTNNPLQNNYKKKKLQTTLQSNNECSTCICHTQYVIMSLYWNKELTIQLLV